jgi:hypothetical protein
MSEVLQANVFFFITGIAVIVFTALLCVALYHLIKILKSVRRVMDRIEAGSEMIADDFAHIRAYFAEESILSRIIRKIFGGDSPRSGREKRSGAAKAGPKAELKIKNEDS